MEACLDLERRCGLKNYPSLAAGFCSQPVFTIQVSGSTWCFCCFDGCPRLVHSVLADWHGSDANIPSRSPSDFLQCSIYDCGNARVFNIVVQICISMHFGIFVDAATSPIPLNVFHTKISKCALVAQGHEDPVKTFTHVSQAKMSSNKQLYH